VIVLLCAGFVLAGVVMTLSWKRRADRVGQLQRIARANGFHYSAQDLWSSTRVPFAVFRLGNQEIVENVLVGQAPDGAPVRVFDYTTWQEEHTSEGTRRSRHRHLTVCLAELEASFPHLVIQPETMATRLLGRLGMPDIELESEEFNRMFVVTCDDEGFARRCLDPTMMDFLISTRGQFQFELNGRWLLVAAPTLPATLCLSLVKLSMTLRGKIPALVWTEAPSMVRGEPGG